MPKYLRQLTGPIFLWRRVLVRDSFLDFCYNQNEAWKWKKNLSKINCILQLLNFELLIPDIVIQSTYLKVFSFSPPHPGVWGFGVWGQGRSPWPQRGPRGAPLFIKLDESLDFRLESKMKFVVATNQILKFHKTKTEPLRVLLAALHSFPWIL